MGGEKGKVRGNRRGGRRGKKGGVWVSEFLSWRVCLLGIECAVVRFATCGCRVCVRYVGMVICAWMSGVI